jgi:hypothetical protein
VCLNGHIIGSCTLMPYSDSEDTKEEWSRLGSGICILMLYFL